MKKLLRASIVALMLAPLSAFAQNSTSGPVGQTNGGAINQNNLTQNSDSSGFNTMALTPALVVPSTSTAAAVWSTNGTGVVSGTLLTTTTTVISSCSATTGVTLPAVQRFVPIVIMNRSGTACLVFPSASAALETAPGTTAAVGASYTLASGADVIFRPVTSVLWLQ